jgi:hypothetical protein
MTTPAPAAPTAPPAPTSDAGKTLGIVGLVLAFVFALAGIIVSAIARSQSKKAGVKNTPATVGLVLSIIFFVIQLIWLAVVVIGLVAIGGVCAEYGPGVWDVNGAVVTCG